jgi:hypothetical protein
MTSINTALLSLLFLISLTGCATMNKSECLNADWQMIGMEDGAQGHPVSQIGKHRKACAEHNIRPDLEAYENGHAAGIKQFCTAANGFRMGKSGGYYGGVCPPELEGEFLAGYDAGKELHAASAAVNQASAAVKSNTSELKQLKEDLQAKEAMLVSSKTSELQRVRLLEEIRADENKVEELEENALALERAKEEKQLEYDEVKRLNQY